MLLLLPLLLLLLLGVSSQCEARKRPEIGDGGSVEWCRVTGISRHVDVAHRCQPFW
jgi:hypothetical protein